MYSRILVPLDGSKLAECILPHAKALAKGCSVGDIVLFKAVDAIPGGSVAAGIDPDSAQKQIIDEAMDYLSTIKEELSVDDINVMTEVAVGGAAELITDYADQQNIDLIMMATHGHSGISRWMHGSITFKVLHSTHVPIMLVRPSK